MHKVSVEQLLLQHLQYYKKYEMGRKSIIIPYEERTYLDTENLENEDVYLGSRPTT